MKRTKISSYAPTRQVRVLIAALLLILVSFTLTSPFYTTQLSDDGLGSSLILSKDGHAEDSSRLLDSNDSVYELIAVLLLAISAGRVSYFVAVSLMAASQFTFTSASPRAPPFPLIQA